MSITSQIQKMTLSEKLQTMESLWDNLSQDEKSIPVPEWHEKELRETASRVAAGEETALDWQEAKKKLRRDLQ